ncbi:MAG: putative metal-binding motif-containing protein [Deltaproteobacteria bacterium]|nr:putative metal-binding motif-containing protein [Deltaproteobacteria bacterium]
MQRWSIVSRLLVAVGFAWSCGGSTIESPPHRDGSTPPPTVDEDRDGFTPADGDCDDTNADVRPRSPETCNGRDDDCDGLLDEVPAGEGCDTGMPGVCAGGEMTCLEGVMTCRPRFTAGRESCNGLDDDCNGMVDDGDLGGGDTCTSDRPGPCAPGTTHCDAGEIVCVTNTPMPGPEACENGIDDDCDGSTDEAPCIMGL